ncbi:hypothetical protein Pcinc_005024 [Petrolisthes cinctipes]|uniref:Uncharacterized protein n=1 Tax=Petrolisthes cinctipes TaxID=88211 RepID=A0AAE1GDL7_PETCI|nr:hypothetical protein Pcinc_005024 [Petrolisthes cinctipes]
MAQLEGVECRRGTWGIIEEEERGSTVLVLADHVARGRMRQTERRSSKYSTRSFKMMSQMTCCKCWVKLVCLVMLLLKIQPSGAQGLTDHPPLINYPPFLTSHTLELRKINIEGEEDVQEGEYELQGIAGGDDEGERQIKWVLGLYFLTRDEDIWQGGVVLNGGGGDDGGGGGGGGGKGGDGGGSGKGGGGGGKGGGGSGDGGGGGGGDEGGGDSGGGGGKGVGGKGGGGGGGGGDGGGDSGGGGGKGGVGGGGSGKGGGGGGNGGGGGGRNGGVELVIWCGYNNTQHLLVNQITSPPITLRIQKGLHWVRLIAVSGGIERILGEQMCHKSQSQLPSLTLAVSFQSTEGEAVKQNCEMIKVSHGPLHPLQLRASTDGLENVMEADFDFYPSSASNITRMVFYFYNTKHNRQEARVVMISLKQGNNHNISDILGVKVIGYKSNTTTNPWTQKTSKMITPLSVKFQVGPFGVRVKETTAGQSRVVIETKKSLAFGVRVKETTAGQPRVVTETNRSLALSRHLRLGVGCWGNGTDCGYVSYSCMKKMGMILNCPSEPNTKKSKFYQKLLSLVLMVTFGVAVVIMLQCLHQLNIILHHLPNTLY